MKSQILLLALTVAALSSCTTAYKTGQTPDDVYFSPARPQDEYVQTENRDDRRYQSREDYYDDRYLRMRMHNRLQWSVLDDYYYFGNRYDYSYYNTGLYWYNPWSPVNYWNCHYNPYYTGYVVVKPSSPIYNRPRTVNLNAYNNNSLTNHNYTNPHYFTSGSTGAARTVTNTYSGGNYNNSSRSSNSNSGGFLRNIFNGNNNSNSGSNSSGGSRTSSGGGSSSSGSSGSSAPVRRF
jgi:hypothetical protein